MERWKGGTRKGQEVELIKEKGGVRRYTGGSSEERAWNWKWGETKKELRREK